MSDQKHNQQQQGSVKFDFGRSSAGMADLMRRLYTVRFECGVGMIVPHMTVVVMVMMSDHASLLLCAAISGGRGDGRQEGRGAQEGPEEGIHPSKTGDTYIYILTHLYTSIYRWTSSS